MSEATWLTLAMVMWFLSAAFLLIAAINLFLVAYGLNELHKLSKHNGS